MCSSILHGVGSAEDRHSIIFPLAGDVVVRLAARLDPMDVRWTNGAPWWLPGCARPSGGACAPDVTAVGAPPPSAGGASFCTLIGVLPLPGWQRHLQRVPNLHGGKRSCPLCHHPIHNTSSQPEPGPRIAEYIGGALQTDHCLRRSILWSGLCWDTTSHGDQTSRVRPASQSTGDSMRLFRYGGEQLATSLADCFRLWLNRRPTLATYRTSEQRH